MNFYWSDYRETDFSCETCGFPLYRVWPSYMVVCVTPTCDSEPLFLVPSAGEGS